MPLSRTHQGKRSQNGDLSLSSFILSDVGRVREKNEDCALIMEDHGLYVVADGMGGHASGEVASQMSIEAIRDFYLGEVDPAKLREDYRRQRESPPAGDRRRNFDEYRLWRSLSAANRHIFRAAQRYRQYRDMGTTVVATTFVKNRIYVGYVGDSRVYRVRKDGIEQLTEDHSLANEYVKMKILRKEDVPRFPYKNIIVRALGLTDEVKVDTFYREVRPGDRFLLCSDGLTDLVMDDEIFQAVMASDDPESGCRVLVDAANDRGGVDNITVLLVYADKAPGQRRRRSGA